MSLRCFSYHTVYFSEENAALEVQEIATTWGGKLTAGGSSLAPRPPPCETKPCMVERSSFSVGK